MRTTFTIIILVAAIAIVASGLIIIPAQNAIAALQRSRISVSTGLGGVSISSPRFSLDTHTGLGATPRPEK
jgi:hypothetical protein